MYDDSSISFFDESIIERMETSATDFAVDLQCLSIIRGSCSRTCNEEQAAVRMMKRRRYDDARAVEMRLLGASAGVHRLRSVV
jgi:hypothetical protein